MFVVAPSTLLFTLKMAAGCLLVRQFYVNVSLLLVRGDVCMYDESIATFSVLIRFTSLVRHAMAHVLAVQMMVAVRNKCRGITVLRVILIEYL
jgi:hypothetical protein